MKLEEKFRAEAWTQASAGVWQFVTLSKSLSKRIRRPTTGVRKPFGSGRVKARAGGTSWETSLFADRKRGALLMPVKADAPRKEKTAPGDIFEVLISFGL